ncbi:MAG: hypothetical protein ACRDF4_00610 [Rhabdochlamydiaceae bacterium]
MREQARVFAKKAKSDNPWVTYSLNEYMRFQKERVEKKEISESTLPNFYEPIKLFCEENDIILLLDAQFTILLLFPELECWNYVVPPCTSGCNNEH